MDNVLTIMSERATRTHEAEFDGVTYEVFKTDDGGGIMRIYDVESNNLVMLQKFLVYFDALSYFNESTKFLTEAE